MKAHPVFARSWDWAIRLAGWTERDHRRALVGPAAGRVLELGAGTGLNFELYREAGRVVAVEPEPTMARKARRRAAEAPVPVVVLRGRGEHLPFRDGSLDAVILCLVMCSVANPARVAAEIRRVLRPGGAIRFYEHVRSLSRVGAALQGLARPAWQICGAGCQPNRDTLSTLRAAGFRVRYRRLSVGPPSPVRPHVLGVGSVP